MDLTPQPKAKEDAEAPLAVVDVDAAVGEQRTAGDKGGTREVLRTEVVDDGGTLGKDEVGEARAHMELFAIDADVVKIEDHQVWQYRQMQEQTLVQHEVVAIATAQGKVTDEDAEVGSPLELLIGCLQSPTHIGEAHQPRTGTTLLHVRLREGSGIGEAPAAEGPVAIDVEHLHVGHALLEKQVAAVERHVARQRLRCLIDDVDAIAVCIGIQVQFVVLVSATHAGRIEGQARCDAAVVGSYADRSLVVGAQPASPYGTFNAPVDVEVGAREIATQLQREPFAWTSDVGSVVVTTEIAGRYQAVDALAYNLMPRLCHDGFGHDKQQQE